MISKDYVFFRDPRFEYTSDFLRFLGEIHLCFIIYGRAPLGPYILPGDPIPAGGSILLGQPSIAPGIMPPPPLPTVLRQRARDDAEAGPSRPPMDELMWSHVRIPVTQALPQHARSLDTVTERHRRGKAPARTAEVEDIIDRPARVGTYHLQPLLTFPGVDPLRPPVKRTSPVSAYHTPTSAELRFNTWVVRHLDEMTGGRYRPRGCHMTAILIESSSEEEDLEEEPEEDPKREPEASATGPGAPQ